MVVERDDGPGAKNEVVAVLDWVVVRFQLFLPRVAWELQPVTGPSKFSLQIALMTVKAAARVEVSKLGLVATTSQAPAAAFARFTWQRRVSPISCTPVAVMSLWPERESFTTVVALNPTPVRSIVVTGAPE